MFHGTLKLPSGAPLTGPPVGAPEGLGMPAHLGAGQAGLRHTKELAAWLGSLGFWLDLVWVWAGFGFDSWALLWLGFGWIRLDFDSISVGFGWLWLDFGLISAWFRLD